jgi:hypothetical protein
MHSANGGTQYERDTNFGVPRMLQLRAKHDEHDVESDNDSSAGDSNRTNDESNLVSDIRHANDRLLSDVI